MSLTQRRRLRRVSLREIYYTLIEPKADTLFRILDSDS